MISEPGDIVLHNESRREQALLALDRVIRERLASGKPGAVGVRLIFNRNKFGPIRVTSEDDL